MNETERTLYNQSPLESTNNNSVSKYGDEDEMNKTGVMSLECMNQCFTEGVIFIKFPNHRDYIAFKKPLIGMDVANHPLVQEYVLNEQKKTSKRNILLGMQYNQVVASMNKPVPSLKLSITPLMFYGVFGHEMYRRSLIFLFGMAFRTLYPHLTLTVEYILHSGYFSEVKELENIDISMIEKVESKMREIVNADLPITEEIVTYEVALDFFNRTNRRYTSLLIMSNNDAEIKFNRCGNYVDLHVLPLVHCTGLLTSFYLRPYKNGMLLYFPSDPYRLEFYGDSPLSIDYALKEIENKASGNKLDESDALIRVLQESKAWKKFTKMTCVGELNNLIRNHTIKHFIAKNHVLHDNKIGKIARTIYKRRDQIKLILISGPSSSGKTTFTKKLSIQLEVLGLRPVILSVDDYYKPRAEMPRNEEGELDFESIDALRIPLLNEHLVALFEGKTVETPIFDFISGEPKPQGRILKMYPDDILLMEGIHCLNSDLTTVIAEQNKFKIFVAPLTQLNLNELEFIHGPTNRLLRRIVRDYNFRGYSAHDTLHKWPAVRRAEHKYIFPYISNANAIVNTALEYEISVLKVYAKPLLRSIQPSDPHYQRAQELLKYLNYFHMLPQIHVPMDSLLREFIGGSFFEQ
jgi:uridine kinase